MSFTVVVAQYCPLYTNQVKVHCHRKKENKYRKETVILNYNYSFNSDAFFLPNIIWGGGGGDEDWMHYNKKINQKINFILKKYAFI